MLKISKIGHGTYGNVYSGKLNEKIYAVKRNFKDNTATWIGNLRELNILSKLKGHPLIIDLIDVRFDNPFSVPLSPSSKSGMDNDNIYFVLEHIEYSCKDYINNQTFSIEIGKFLVCQILLALEHCHYLNITHRDLKPENILITIIDDNPLIKLCDFGMSQFLCENTPSTPGVATSWYRAPEICVENPYYGQISDIWSLGCVVFEIFGKTPFLVSTKDKSNAAFNAILRKYPVVPDLSSYSEYKVYIKQKNLDPNIKRKTFTQQMNLSEEIPYLEDFMSKMLEIDFKKRWNATQLLDHEFLHSFSTYISDFREKYPPGDKNLPCIRIVKSTERNYIIDIVINIYNNRDSHEWYKHRILFHAIDLYDRYLEYKYNNNLQEDDKNKSILQFYVCLYIFHKFYVSMDYCVTWEEFIPAKLNTKTNYVNGERFEKFLIQTVTNYNFYRETLYEIPDHYEDILSEQDIQNLLYEYLKIDLWEEKSVRALYRKIFKQMT